MVGWFGGSAVPCPHLPHKSCSQKCVLKSFRPQLALVPKPRVNLTRYHGVLAPNHRWRGEVTPAKRGKGVNRIANTEVRSPAERHVAMSWAQRLKRVFNIDIEVCGRCGGSVKVIACIEDQDIIDRILAHLRDKELATPSLPLLTPPSRAPPETR